MNITDATDSTSILVDAKDLDERIAAFTQLVELHVRECPADLKLPPAVLQLSALRTLSIHSAHDVVVRVPALLAQLPLTSLWLDSVDVVSLALPPTLQNITLRSRDAASDVPYLQQALSSSAPSVTSVTIIAAGSQPAPGGWAALPALRELELSLFQPGAPDLRGSQVESLEVRLATLDEVKLLASSVPGLKSLKVSADTGNVPEEIGALTQLESLGLYAPVTSLPSSVTQLRNLKQLRLSKLPGRALPEAIGALPALEELDVAAEINTLPVSLAQLSTLKRLSLRGALNKGALVSRWDDVTTLSPLPAALSLLTSLEELDLSQCGVFDAAPLRPLQQLRVLKMAWSAITTLDDIAALSALEELDLEHTDRVRDFSPLRNLQRLRVLNIANTRPQSLDALKGIASLKVLDIKHIEANTIRAVFDLDVDLTADNEVLERYKERQQLRRLRPIDTMVAQLGSEDVDTVATALDDLASYVLMSSTREINAIESALAEPDPAAVVPQAAEEQDAHEQDGDDGEHEDGDDDLDLDLDLELELEDDDEEAEAPRPRHKVRWHVLESCIERHVEALPTPVLTRLFSALFQQMHEDHPTASRIADEILARGSDDDQRALVAAFVSASEYYDTGHRMWEATVQDHLIDEVFGQLRQPALVQLLADCSVGHFVDDGMMDLWGTALERASEADVEQVRESFEQLAAHRAEYASADELAAFWALVDVGGPAVRALVQKTRHALAAQLAHKERLAMLQTLCSNADTLGQGLKQLLALDDAELNEIASGALRRMPRTYGTLGETTGIAVTVDDELVDLITIYRRINDRWGMPDVLRAVCGRGPEAAAQLLSRAGVSIAEQGTMLRTTIVDTLCRLEERRGWDDDDDENDESDNDDDENDNDNDNDNENDDDNNDADDTDVPLLTLRTDDTLAPLRAWAAFVDGNDGAAGRRAEFLVAVERLGHFESNTLRVVIGLLSEAEAPDGGFDLGKQTSELAGDIGQCAAEEPNWPAYRLLARHLDKLVLNGRTLERILAQLLGVSINAKDPGAVRCVLQQVPPVVEWDILAYNLACHFAVVGDRDGVLKWAQRSLELGKSPSQFAADHDFDAFRSDPAFVAVMASTR